MRPLLIPTLLAALALAACETNQATGARQFTAFMSREDEVKVGSDEHPKVVKEFGGEYDDPRIRAYVQDLGKRLAARSEMPDLDWRFTVLNSDVVNAFALPGGYVYVTRALMALASSEAELAGVLGHEIGHVTGRHTAERYSRATAAQLGATGLGILVGVLTGSGALAQGASQAAGSGAQLYLASYSRDQEFQADELGVRYLARNGYDPEAMARFLEKLAEDTRLSAALMGRPEAADEFSIMQTHPRTPDRVRAAIAEAGEAGRIVGARTGRDEYLRTIDGLIWGGDNDSGFIKGRTFVHPGLRVRFEVPDGFRVDNLENAVIARGPENALAIFTTAARAPRGDGAALAAYMRQNNLTRVEQFDVDRLPAATGVRSARLQDGTAVDARFVLIGAPSRVWQFVFITRQGMTARFEPQFLRMTRSFDQMTPAEAAAQKPYRIRLVRAEASDTAESLARRMGVQEEAVRRFQLLNGLKPGDRPVAGQTYKIIAE